jgi:hypothetical protein
MSVPPEMDEAEITVSSRLEAGAGDRVEEAGRRAEDRDAFVRCEVEERPHVGMGRRAVVEAQRRLGGETRYEPVPHHPAAGGEVEEAIAGPEVDVEAVLLQVLEQRPARAVHDALGRAGGARRVEDVERVVEGQTLPGDGVGRVAGEHVAEPDSVGDGRRVLPGVGHDHEALDARQLLTDLTDARQRVEEATAVAVAIRDEQHLRPDLAEAVQDALYPEVGRARRPDRAQARRRQHRDHGLGEVRQVAHHAVAGHDPPFPQCRGEVRHLIVELRVAEAARFAVFAPEEQCRRVVAAPQQVLGEVEARVREPFGAGHAQGANALWPAGTVAHHLGEIPHRVPEGSGLLHRPAVERPVVGQDDAVLRLHAAREGRELGPLDALGRRLPQRGGHGSSE